MKIELKKLTIREVASGFEDLREGGVFGYDGRLNIRPKYQREFVYKEKERNAVIDTILKGFPLNVMYWAVNEDGSYEIIDGQQRTISFSQFVDGKFATVFPDGHLKYFHSLTSTEKQQILDYELMIYFCEGNDKEKLDWFKIINIAGVELTQQELRNAVYTGAWLADAKAWFSKTGCPAYGLASDYINGSPIRQDFLETALKWISKGSIEGYMSTHQNDPNANELWTYFSNVINWAKLTFSNYRNLQKGLNWGVLYDVHRDEMLDAVSIEEEISRLLMDDDITNQKGIYAYVLNRDEKHLNIRKFTESMRRSAYERQGGMCVACNNNFLLTKMEADHITPWSKGGKTNTENCQMLCIDCNRRKSNK
ncbi:MAG: DUF262 domain-containing protein [Defluviitaleaceae bacterium]|nr:DUF262 domain-containing protein [Defluviitaleaceae bacterium]